MSRGLKVEYCGEWAHPDPAIAFSIGREGDLVIDDNPYLHRHFLELNWRDELWWMVNVGGQLAATVADVNGRFQAWLAPGAHLPLVFGEMDVRFSAGPTTYSFSIFAQEPLYDSAPWSKTDDGTTTLGRVVLAPEQLQLVVALAEPVLRSNGSGATRVPSSAEAAARLGWPITKFNRKLDNVCQKLKRAGVQGLHGDIARLAADRRLRLVEYALAVRLVTPSDMALLPSTNTPPAK